MKPFGLIHSLFPLLFCLCYSCGTTGRAKPDNVPQGLVDSSDIIVKTIIVARDLSWSDFSRTEFSICAQVTEVYKGRVPVNAILGFTEWVSTGDTSGNNNLSGSSTEYLLFLKDSIIGKSQCGISQWQNIYLKTRDSGSVIPYQKSYDEYLK